MVVMVSTCCSGPWLNLSGTTLFIFYTPAEILWHQGPLLTPPTPPGVTIKTHQILTLALSPSSINALWLKPIILSNFPFSEDALFVLVPFCGIRDQYYGFPGPAHQVFFFFKSVCEGLPFDETEIASTFPTKSSTIPVFFKSCLADRDNVHLGLMILFYFQMESPVGQHTDESHT